MYVASKVDWKNNIPPQNIEQKLLIAILLQQDEKFYQGKVEVPAHKKGGSVIIQLL